MKYNSLTDYKIKKIIRCFVFDLTATQTSIFSCASRNTINNYFKIFRESIFNHLEKDKPTKINGEIELDESYFGARRVRGKSLLLHICSFNL